MKEKARRILVIVGVAVLAGATAVGAYFLRGEGNGYRAAERAHDARFGEYADVTFIGHDERAGDALVIVIVSNKPMPNDLFFDEYEPFLVDWTIGLVRDEPGVEMLVWRPWNNNEVIVMALSPIDLGTSGTLDGGLLSFEVAAGPLEEKHLIWRDE